MSVVPSTWLTAVRLERLCIVALAIPSSQLGAPASEIIRSAWDMAGGDIEETSLLVAILKKIGFAVEIEGILRRTRDGDRVTRALRSDDRTPLGRALIRAGLLHDQARHLIESGKTDQNGDLKCERRAARVGAGQLIGLLTWWDVTDWPLVVVPKALLRELNSVWALLPPPPETPTWVLERQAMGDRAEMYTVQLEKLRATDPSQIAWVARDSSSFGWDVEDRAALPPRQIEVKGSQGTDPIFFLSENEWRKANEHADTYEIHFWGGLSLSRQAADEFDLLRAAGFPIIIRNIVQQVGAGNWRADAVKWRVYRRTSDPAVVKKTAPVP